MSPTNTARSQPTQLRARGALTFKQIRAILKQSRSKGSARLVLVGVLLHADRNGECDPSAAGLAELAGVNRATVFPALDELEALGEVRREQRGGGRKRRVKYRLIGATVLAARKPSGPDVETVTLFPEYSRL